MDFRTPDVRDSYAIQQPEENIPIIKLIPLSDYDFLGGSELLCVFYTLSIQVCPKKGISPTILYLGLRLRPSILREIGWDLDS